MAKRRSSSDQKNMSMIFGGLIALLGIGFLVGVIMSHKPIPGLAATPVSLKSTTAHSTSTGTDKTGAPAGTSKDPAATQAADQPPAPGVSTVAVDPADKASGVPAVPVVPAIPTFGQ